MWSCLTVDVSSDSLYPTAQNNSTTENIDDNNVLNIVNSPINHQLNPRESILIWNPILYLDTLLHMSEDGCCGPDEFCPNNPSMHHRSLRPHHRGVRGQRSEVRGPNVVLWPTLSGSKQYNIWTDISTRKDKKYTQIYIYIYIYTGIYPIKLLRIVLVNVVFRVYFQSHRYVG